MRGDKYIKPSLDGKEVVDRWTIGSNQLFQLEGTKKATNPDHEMLVSRGFVKEIMPEYGHGFELGELVIGVEDATYEVVASAPPQKDRLFISRQLTLIKDYYIGQVCAGRSGNDLSIPGSITPEAAAFGWQVLNKFDVIAVALAATLDKDLAAFDYLSTWDDLTDFEQPLTLSEKWRDYMDSITWNTALRW